MGRTPRTARNDFTEEQKDKIVKLYEPPNSLTTAIIGQRFGCSSAHISHILKERNVSTSRRKRWT